MEMIPSPRHAASRSMRIIDGSRIVLRWSPYRPVATAFP
jgi:hypothetical protein